MVFGTRTGKVPPHRPAQPFSPGHWARAAGFTLIELLVVLAVMATLTAIVAPRYWQTVEKAQETVLRENLRTLRTAIDQHFTDHGKYPDALEDLVSQRYVRSVPVDPMTDSATTWVLIEPKQPSNGKIYDIRSAAPGTAIDGKPFNEL